MDNYKDIINFYNSNRIYSKELELLNQMKENSSFETIFYLLRVNAYINEEFIWYDMVLSGDRFLEFLLNEEKITKKEYQIIYEKGLSDYDILTLIDDAIDEMYEYSIFGNDYIYFNYFLYLVASYINTKQEEIDYFYKSISCKFEKTKIDDCDCLNRKDCSCGELNNFFIISPEVYELDEPTINKLKEHVLIFYDDEFNQNNDKYDSIDLDENSSLLNPNENNLNTEEFLSEIKNIITQIDDVLEKEMLFSGTKRKFQEIKENLEKTYDKFK